MLPFTFFQEKYLRPYLKCKRNKDFYVKSFEAFAIKKHFDKYEKYKKSLRKKLPNHLKMTASFPGKTLPYGM